MEQVKQFKTYGEQAELLRQRGMRVNDPEHAEMLLARLNYYRLSGYWYPMRRFSQGDGTAQDEFIDGASFDLVVALYGFDEQLRHSVFIELDRVELAIRTKLGHELGRLDPLIYLDPQRLNARARQRNKDGRSVSWLKSLNILRNYAAHHARMFNRVYVIKPKLNNDVRLAPVAEGMNRVFGQLSLIQYLHRQLDLSPADRLPKLFDTYPHNPIVPFSRIGAPDNWRELPLWRV